jgi:hypothetical protein
MMKICIVCGVSLPEESYYFNRGKRGNQCKTCANAKSKERYAASPQRKKAYNKAWRAENRCRRNATDNVWYRANKTTVRGRMYHLKKYGMTLDGYQLMFLAQNGRCAICRNPPADGQVLRVDHDHSSGEVRGLLCLKCNVGLGCFRDSVAIVESALEYLRPVLGSDSYERYESLARPATVF